MAVLNGCCDETGILKNPFADFRDTRKRGQMAMFDAQNPIPEEIKDTDELSKVFEDWKLVPYAGRDGKTGHSLLIWYAMLAQLSPTNAACISKICSYVVGSKAVFERAEDPEYNPGNEAQPLSIAEKTAYESALKEVVTFEGGVRKFHKSLFASMKRNGNGFVEVAISTINGQTKAVVKYLKTTSVLYKVVSPGDIQAVAISPVWESNYLKKHTPRVVPIAPNFVDDGGVKRAVFHLKEGDNFWYGRPDSMGGDIYKYREVQDSLYLVKQSAANFVGQLIIEVEDDDSGSSPAIDNEDAKRSGFSSFADRLEQNHTQKGTDPQAVMVTARPIGSKPMFVFQVQPNTNENWYKETGEQARQIIIMNHGITQRFMGLDVSNGLASDAFVSDYVMNVEPTINDLRSTLMAFTNGILDTIWQFAGMEEMSLYSLDFQSPIQSQIKQYKTAQTQQQQANGSPNIDNGV